MRRTRPLLFFLALCVLAWFWATRDSAPAPAAPDAVAEAPERPRSRTLRPVVTRIASPDLDEPELPTANPELEPALSGPDDELDDWEAAAVRLDIAVIDADGYYVEHARVISPDCPLMAYAADGEVTIFPEPGVCTFQALRFDGLLASRSAPAELDMVPGDHIALELVLPAERTGGLGVQIGVHDEGVEVLGVMQGTPAWAQGLEEGDVIVEVDGIPAVDLEMEEFVEVMTGPEGSEVDFVVAYPDGDTGLIYEEITITRQVLEE